MPVTTCPSCGSGNLKYIERAAIYFCKNCDHEFLAEKPITPMRLFLSYGHDDNEELVLRIKADLEKRGHDVWFDKSEIKFGDDWRRSITEGILKSNRVLSFLSKHSTRDPGVCRDEIAIAIGVKEGNIQTVLIESEQEVQPPVNISHIQWLDMHDWRKRRDAGEDAWEAWYKEKFAEIVRVVESDESRRFAGEIETLSGHLKPIKSDARINNLLKRGFYGREWLFEAAENWRSAPKGTPSRLFWIMGAPGVGKSAFAAQLTHKHGDSVIAAQFCEWDKPDHSNAQRVIRSLAFQLAARLPDYRKLLLTLPEITELDRKTAAELFDYLLANPLRSVIDGGRNKYLIVIDALDEAGESGRNPLVEMLARNAKHLPDWLGLVVTSRPEFDVKTPFQALNPFPLDTESESNRADIRDYLHNELAPHLRNRPDNDRLVEQILEKSEGVFLYVERFCDDVRQHHLSLDQPEQFPQGLGGIFDQYFKRQFPDLEKFRKDVRPALRAILAAREPLPIEILQSLFNWQDEELRNFTRPIASLFPVTTEAGHEVIKPYHKSLADWLGDEEKAGEYLVSVKEGHRVLADYGWQEYESGPAKMQDYFLRYLHAHLLLVGDKSRSQHVRQDKQFIHAREIRFYGERRSMRVYICSTLRDMEAERDYMIRRTFPELNRLLDPHRIDTSAVDLRWGLPEDIISDWDTLQNVIFGEIDRCRPFFIGLCGERKGWIPQHKTTSTFEDELYYATNNANEGRVGKFIYIRSRQSLSDVPAEVAREYRASGPEEEAKMAYLNDRLKNLNAVQRTYDCYWDNRREQLWGLQNFGSMVLSDLYQSAIEWFGKGPSYATKVDQRLQRDYAYRLLKTFVGRKNLIEQCYELVTSTPYLRICLIGQEGVGKSALLAAVVDRLRTTTVFTLVVHHAGASASSLTTRGVLENWCEQLEDWVAKPITASLSLDDLRKEFSSCAKLACIEGTTVFVLDNADWVESVSGKGSVDWLLQSIPKDAIVLTSSRKILASHAFQFMSILPFEDVEVRNAIEVILSTYSKQLSSDNINLILCKPGVRHPGILLLLLRILVSSVRHYEDLSSRLRNMPDTFAGLCDIFFDSLEYDYGVSSVSAGMQKLILSKDDGISSPLNITTNEVEIVRQIYAVLPEHCTPPEEGMRIQFGALRNAIRTRYVQI